MSALIANPFGDEKTDHGSGALAQLERREEAEIMAMVAVAKRFPRDEHAATKKIGAMFERHTLAEESVYSYTRGGQEVSDLTIRAMEGIARAWGNIDSSWNEVTRGIGEDGVAYSLVEAKAWDLEATTRKRITFIVRHWRDTKSGGYRLRDERDIYELCANMAQRRVRACLSSLIPEDVKNYARKVADQTMATKAEVTPDSLKALLDAFADFGVTKEHIEARIQRNLDAMQPAQLVRMRKIYRSLKEGASSPGEWFDGLQQQEPANGKQGTSLQDIKDKAAAVDPAKAAQAAERVKELLTPEDSAVPLRTKPTPPPEGDLAGAPPQDLLPTFDDLKGKLSRARSVETLDAHADFIRYFKDEAQRLALDDAYKARKAHLEGGGK